jgi:hypothetical protein
MNRGVRLLAIILGVAALNLLQPVGAQSASPQPTATAGTSLDNPSINSSNQPPTTTPSNPNPATSSPRLTDPLTLGRDKIIRLKIFLDQRSFGPGEIDDRWSGLSSNALRLYQAANGGSAIAEIDPQLDQELTSLNPTYITYQIKPNDLVWVGKSPPRPVAQANRKSMPYPSLADFVAERFHTSIPFLARLNQGKDLSGLHPGDTVQVPNLAPMEMSSLKAADDISPRTGAEESQDRSRHQEQILDRNRRRKNGGGFSDHARLKSASGSNRNLADSQDNDLALVSVG